MPKKKKRTFRRKQGKTNRCGKKLGLRQTKKELKAMHKVVTNFNFLFEYILTFLHWKNNIDSESIFPSYAKVNHFMMDVCLRDAAFNYSAFEWWFDQCCDPTTGYFRFNKNEKTERIFLSLLWENHYNDIYFDDLVEGCRSNCFASENKSQKIKSRHRNYAMLKLFQIVANHQLLGHSMLKYAYHLVGQWMVGHVKDWCAEIHKAGFFVQLRELFFWWTKAALQGCKASNKAKVHVFLLFSRTLFRTKKEKKEGALKCVFI